MERFLFKKIELWLVLLLLLLGLIGTILFGWMVLYYARGGQKAAPLPEIAHSIAEWPQPAIDLLQNGLKRTLQPQLQPFQDFSYLQIDDPAFEDDGFILVPGYREEYGHTAVYLYSLADQAVVHSWLPPIAEIREATTIRDWTTDEVNYRALSPVLLEDGGLVFHSGNGPLARIDACGGLVWASDNKFHHAIEQTAEGGFAVAIRLAKEDPRSLIREGLRYVPFLEDGMAIVDAEGNLAHSWSLRELLEAQGYQGLLYGVGRMHADRLHINDVQPVLESDGIVQKGDLFISIRELSAVALFRPSTEQILWLQVGPWVKQHDVDYHGDGIITVYGNDVAQREGGKEQLLFDSNRIYQVDLRSKETTTIFDGPMQNVATLTQGLHEVLANGDVFVEEQNQGVLHRLSEAGSRWRFVNTQNEDYIGAIHWSRYVPAGDPSLAWLGAVTCPAEG